MGRARAVNGRSAPRLRVGRCPLRVTARLSAQPKGPRLKTHEESVPLSVESQEKFDALCAEYERIQESDSDEQA